MNSVSVPYAWRNGPVPRARIDVAALCSMVVLSNIVRRRVKLKPVGGEFIGLCPFHNERTPSFRVNDPRGAFYCFGCGARGDAVRFVMDTERLGFLDACRWLMNDERPLIAPSLRAAAKEVETVERKAKSAHVAMLWTGAGEVAGTPGETYLRRRGLSIGTSQPDLRFARCPVWKDYASGRTGPSLPALVGAIRSLAGDVIGVHRIFLTEDGGKAPMAQPKLSLGHVSGGALRLGPPPTDELVLCEGPEDGLTLVQELGISVWVALGTANLPNIKLPSAIRKVTIAGDNNSPGFAAVRAAAVSFSGQGREVRTMFPDQMFADFNDQLQGIAR